MDKVKKNQAHDEEKKGVKLTWKKKGEKMDKKSFEWKPRMKRLVRERDLGPETFSQGVLKKVKSSKKNQINKKVTSAP